MTVELGWFLEKTMEDDFFKLYERQSQMAVDVGHNSVADWGIHIYERRGQALGNWGAPVISETGCDRKQVFARAYIALTEYLSDTQGGY